VHALGDRVVSSGSSAPVPDASSSVVPPRTRFQQGIRQPKVRNDGIVRWLLLTSTGETENLNEALTDANWKSAMQDEYDALIANNTWHLVPPSPNKNVIDCKWVYRIKKMLMVRLTDTKLVLLQKVSNRGMT
jgi:histone deacetylase 1/2